ncbi:MAG: hypothetical protein LIP08_12065 [Bacteroides sp.]|nr:hypothetical protein [Bacteroides sp.]
MRIVLAGETSDGETSDQVSRAAAISDLSYEHRVNNFTVYVFNADTETLEATVTSSGVSSTVITGLSTGFKKKVVVAANLPVGYPVFDEGEEYSKFLETASAIDLDSQSPALAQSNGLVMFGETESDVALSASSMVSITIPLKRLVAKVTLGNVTVKPADSYDINEFEITGVSIQRAVAKTDILGSPLTDETQTYGGVLGSYNSTLKNYLLDALNPIIESGTTMTMGNFFYVLPNQSSEHCTLLTLEGTYDGVVQYYPIRINFEQTSNVNTDGTLVLSNKTYRINLELNNLAEGTTDPDLPPTKADLKVNVEVTDWDLEIVQNETW